MFKEELIHSNLFLISKKKNIYICICERVIYDQNLLLFTNFIKLLQKKTLYIEFTSYMQSENKNHRRDNRHFTIFEVSRYKKKTSLDIIQTSIRKLFKERSRNNEATIYISIYIHEAPDLVSHFINVVQILGNYLETILFFFRATSDGK